MFLIILFKSIIIGGLVGVGVGAGAARMFHAPTTQGMGAFRTTGELNSCEGDPASHFSFGLGFFFNAWASSVAAGSFTQDVDHRIIPHWGAAALMVKNRNLAQTLHDPKKMAIACGIIGMLVVAFLNTTASAVPAALQVTAIKVLVPAANLLVNTVMPVIFWLAAIDAGRRSGFWGTIFGGLAQLIMGNAVPGPGAGHSDRQRRGRERLEQDHQDHDGGDRAAVRAERLLPRLRHESSRVLQPRRAGLAGRHSQHPER